MTKRFGGMPGRVVGWVLSVLLAASSLFSQTRTPAPPASAAHPQLVIVLDGLRPDYVTQDVMPNLYALGQRGVVFANHHAIYPTVTRVNAASISTGSYPERHGLLGNAVYFPQVDATRFLDTSDRLSMLRVDAATQGNLLTAPTLGEILQTAGRKMLVVSAGSTGSAFLLNHKVSGGAILHMEYTLPESLGQEVNQQLGPLDADASSEVLNRRAVDLFLKVGLPKVDPAVTVMWLTDPDTTAHEKGIGDPATIECLKKLDTELKRIQDGLAAIGRLKDYDIWVTSDHGFSTHTGAAALPQLLKPFTRPMPDGSPRIIAGGDGAIYIRDHDLGDTARIVGVLQQAAGVGAIFTEQAERGSRDGWAPGTLSFDAIRWTHDRSAEIMFSPDWTDQPNALGIHGTAASGGVAGHGSSSPFDVHNTLIAAGPDLKRATTLRTTSGNVDFAPTLLALAGIAVPTTMQGRILSEAFVSATGNPIASRTDLYTVKTADGAYSATASFSVQESGGRTYRYFDWAKAERR